MLIPDESESRTRVGVILLANAMQSAPQTGILNRLMTLKTADPMNCASSSPRDKVANLEGRFALALA